MNSDDVNHSKTWLSYLQYGSLPAPATAPQYICGWCWTCNRTMHAESHPQVPPPRQHVTEATLAPEVHEEATD